MKTDDLTSRQHQRHSAKLLAQIDPKGAQYPGWCTKVCPHCAQPTSQRVTGSPGAWKPVDVCLCAGNLIREHSGLVTPLLDRSLVPDFMELCNYHLLLDVADFYFDQPINVTWDQPTLKFHAVGRKHGISHGASQQTRHEAVILLLEYTLGLGKETTA